jgi:hypothetical protein
MPRYTFRVVNGKYSESPDQSCRFQNDAEAWTEMRKVSADLVGGVCRALEQDSDWHIELLDETGKPLFRISVVAESLT